jgi:hypothetical protein
MSESYNAQHNDLDYNEEKVEKARSRRHKVRWSNFLVLFVLFASVSICIYIIEHYQ